MHFRTRAIHVGSPRDPATGAVIPPIHLATTFVQPSPGEWGEFDYSRSGNPTRAAFEKGIANLEGGIGGLAYASGMAAITGVVLAFNPGQRIVAGRDIYGGTYRLLHQVARRLGIEVLLIDTSDLAAVEEAMAAPTALLWLETPGNPLLSIVDIAACCEIAKRYEVPVAVDNTFATPVLTRPLELGADIVIHSATKYIGGHSDVLGGCVVAREKAMHDRLYYLLNATGGVMNPLESYLSARGLKTLELRVREQSRTAQAIADHLAGHPKVKRVLYPGLADHPGHAIAARQMDGAFGAMLSFETTGNFESAKRVVGSTKLFQLAVSLGAVESLIEQPASMSHASYAPEARKKFGIADTLIRVSVGLEHVDDLIDDLDTALATA